MARRLRIAFLLGKPPERSPTLPAVLERLRRWGVDVAVEVPGGALDPRTPARGADLAVLRGLRPAVLDAVRRVEHTGVTCCNPVAATLAVGDRATTTGTLARAGIAVPATRPAATWAQVRDAAAGRSVAVKAVDGGRGRGAGVVVAGAGALPADAPFAGPYVVQQRIRGDGRDRKLYVVGGHVAGLRKRWPPRDPGDAVAFRPSAVLEGLAQRVGAATGLSVYGVDVVDGAGGPVVVDVNALPSCRGVPGAAARLAGHLAETARGGAA